MAKKLLKKAQDGDAVRKYQREQALIADAKAQLEQLRLDKSKSLTSISRSPRVDKASIKKSQLANLDSLEKMYSYPKKKMGGMIKRADGSYSKRGLWDNIRANKGSGKKPTAAMLKQEKKIKAQSKKK
jgi:hypothetical protein